ncbi:MAG: hypothetical protein EBT86_02250 [Actinobacteria bacterium]|nr:hypothetical protein [Actinomycetota bacterium]
MQIQQMSQLFNTNTNSLGQTQTQTQHNLSNKKFLIVSPKHTIRSGYSRVAKAVNESFQRNSSISTSTYEIITPDLSELTQKIQTGNYDIIFLIIPFYLAVNVTDNLKSQTSWLYYKPHNAYVFSDDMIILNERFSRIFTPTIHLQTLLSKVIKSPIEFLDIAISSLKFYPVNKNSARKILNIYDKIQDNSRIWLAPSSNCYESRLDTIIRAFVEILSKYPNDILLFLGDSNNPDGYSLQEIYLNMLFEKKMDVEKYGKNIIFLNSLQILSGLSDHHLNIIFNCADYVIYANSFSGHMFSILEIMKSNPSIPIIVPRHSWFRSLSNMGKPQLRFCEPSQILYRCGNQGYDYIIHPIALYEEMKNVRENVVISDFNSSIDDGGHDCSCDLDTFFSKILTELPDIQSTDFPLAVSREP